MHKLFHVVGAINIHFLEFLEFPEIIALSTSCKDFKASTDDVLRLFDCFHGFNYTRTLDTAIEHCINNAKYQIQHYLLVCVVNAIAKDHLYYPELARNVKCHPHFLRVVAMFIKHSYLGINIIKITAAMVKHTQYMYPVMYITRATNVMMVPYIPPHTVGFIFREKERVVYLYKSSLWDSVFKLMQKSNKYKINVLEIENILNIFSEYDILLKDMPTLDPNDIYFIGRYKININGNGEFRKCRAAYLADIKLRLNAQ